MKAIKCSSFLFILLLVILAFAAGSVTGAPKVFYGIDPGAKPGDPCPNSIAAASAFIAAAAPLGLPKDFDFELAPEGKYTSIDMPPCVSFTSQGADIEITDNQNQHKGFNVTANGKKFLSFCATKDADATLTAVFNRPVLAFGGFITGAGDKEGDLRISYYDGQEHEIDVLASSYSSGGVVYFGFTNPGKPITQLTFKMVTEDGKNKDIIGIDNIYYVLGNGSYGSPIPEPSTLVLFGTGMLAPLFRLLRRKISA